MNDLEIPDTPFEDDEDEWFENEEMLQEIQFPKGPLVD